MNSTWKSVLFWFAIIVTAFGIYQYSSSRSAPGSGGELRENGRVLAWRDGSVWTRP